MRSTPQCRSSWSPVSLALVLLCTVVGQTTGSSADLATLREDFGRILAAVETWEGNVRIQVTRKSEPYVASGTFSWDAVNERFRCGVEYPATFNKLDAKSKITETTTKDLLREVIVERGVRTAIWHGVPNATINGFAVPARDKGRIFSIAYRKDLEPYSLTVPQLEFCPEFLFRGQMPSMKETLRLAQESLDNSGNDSLHGVGDDGRYFLRTPGGGTVIYFAKLGNAWLPSEFDSKDLKMQWIWSPIENHLIPTSLRIDDSENEQSSIFQVTENQINKGIDESVFDYNTLRVREGDYLADNVNNILLRYDGADFVDPNSTQGNVGRGRFIGFLLLLGCVLLCGYFAIRKRKKPV